MSTTYTDSNKPKFYKWGYVAAFVLGFVCIALYIGLSIKYDYDFIFLMLIGFLLIIPAKFAQMNYKAKYSVDEQADTLTDERDKRHPVIISRIKTITYHEGKDGKLRSILIRDNGSGFMNIRIKKEIADQMVQQLVKANPSIEVRHTNHV